MGKDVGHRKQVDRKYNIKELIDFRSQLFRDQSRLKHKYMQNKNIQIAFNPSIYFFV